MSERLFIDSYKYLDNPGVPEDECVEQIEQLARRTFPQLSHSEIERLVLDILMAHHRQRPATEAARAQKITTTRSAPPPAASLADLTLAGDDDANSKYRSIPEDAILKTDRTPFDQLRDVLGSTNSDADIERVLAHNDFDYERTLELLAGEPANLELSKEQTAARIICRYYILGRCVRGSQCMYSHDGSRRICRFWLHGRCQAGDDCIFMHGVPRLPEKYRLPPPEPKRAPISLQTLQSLPALGAKKSAAKPGAAKAPVFAGTQAAAMAANTASNDRLSVALMPIQEALGELNTGLVPLAKPRLTPWVELAFHNNQQYTDLRNAAYTQAELRNKLLQQSTKAWSQNNSGVAKELSDRGREHEQQMMQCNREAARLLWDQRKVPSSEIWIDLHGLHFIDAIEDLRLKLDGIAQHERHQPRCVYIISGRGHFFAKRYADQMTQYVRALLDTEGYKHRDLGVNPKYGRITVVDPWSKMRDITID